MRFSRRDFLGTAAVGAVGVGLGAKGASPQENNTKGSRPLARGIIISSGNGFGYIDEGYDILSKGGDTLDAAMRVVRGPEDDPNDDSVGLGGLPNEEGVVELDACCMHGPTRRAGAVGGVRNIKNVSLVAKAVMERTGHVMLVGEGAERFAVAQGFPRENLLTEHSRKVWMLWKESHSDWWGPGLASPEWKKRLPSGSAANFEERTGRLFELAESIGIEPELQAAAVRKILFPPTGTIHCSALNAKGEISGCTTTSGLAWKIPGRCGDSPIIAAGCFTDPEIGSAGATGSGEENIKVAGAHTIIENMRHGMSPFDAGMDALQRIVRNYGGNKDRLRYLDMTYYVLRCDGVYAGVSLWTGYDPGRPHKIAVHDGTTKRNEKTHSLFEGESQEWPPTPVMNAK